MSHDLSDLTTPQWAALLNAINESLNIVDPAEFLAAAGFTRPEALGLHEALGAATTPHEQRTSDAQLAQLVRCLELALTMVDDDELELRVGITGPSARALLGSLERRLDKYQN